ncbi:Mobile element protein [Methanosarcina sp. WWM596]|nr:Mobile element protein [Methanosarcina sp. WWM596]
MVVEFKEGKRVIQVTKRRARKDFTQFVKIFVTEKYSEAEVI